MMTSPPNTKIRARTAMTQESQTKMGRITAKEGTERGRDGLGKGGDSNSQKGPTNFQWGTKFRIILE